MPALGSGRLTYVRLFQGLHVTEQIVDLVRIQLEYGHRGVAGFDAFRQAFGESFHRVAQMQGAERRSDLERARTDAVYGVTAGAVGERKGLAPLAQRERRPEQ